jgi:integrase
MFRGLRAGILPAGFAACTIVAVFSTATVRATAADIAGKVQGANSPIAGSTVTLYAAGTGTPVQLAQSKTDDNGAFRLNVGKAPASSILYVIARGGTPRASPVQSANAAIALLAVLGTTPPKAITVNEFTTVASVWTSAQFLIGDTLSGHLLGLRIAAGNVPNFVDLATGGWGDPIQGPLNSGQTPTMSNFATLADLLSGCITRVKLDSCESLFAAATPPGWTAPTDTLNTFEAIALFPWYQPGRLYALLDQFYPIPRGKNLRPVPFMPYLNYAPSAWVLPLKFDGGGYRAGGKAMFDSEGNLWVGDNFTVGWQGNDLLWQGGATKFAPNGKPLSPITTGKALPTRRLAERELASRLALVNGLDYKATRIATFAEYAKLWQTQVLTQHKPSTQAVLNSQIKNHLVPFFGARQLREINLRMVQDFVSQINRTPKTKKNIILGMRMIWKSARAAEYVTHNPFDGLTLPRQTSTRPMFFSLDEVRAIIEAAEEPHRTLYRIAAETGMRAGELCGLRFDDLNLSQGYIEVRQSAWRGKLQSPKTSNAVRHFPISRELAAHLELFVHNWRPNANRLLFPNTIGGPMHQPDICRYSLHPILAALNIKRCGLKAFRHTNETLMDRLSTPMKVRQERLGHKAGSDITMQVYTHTLSADHRSVADKLGELLRPSCAYVEGQPAWTQ